MEKTSLSRSRPKKLRSQVKNNISMMQNTRRSRAMFLLAMGFLQVVHHHLFADFPNTDEGMLVYHGTAALADMYLIYVASELLSGELSFQIQCLNLASIVTNAVGYFAYTQYISHWYYDMTMLGVGCVLIYKLMRIPDHDSRHFGCALVSDFDRGFNQFYNREAHR